MSKTASYLHKVQYYETDQMQVVHHSNYFRWYEEARTAFMESIDLGYANLEAMGIIIPVTAVESEYIGAAQYPQTIEIKSRIVKFSGVRMTVKYELYNTETQNLINKGTSEHAFVDQDFCPFALQKKYPEVYQTLLDYTVKES